MEKKFSLLELSAEGKREMQALQEEGELLRGVKRQVLHESDSSVANFFLNDGGWQLETQRG